MDDKNNIDIETIINEWKNANNTEDMVPSSHIYAYTMSYIMNAPHIQRTDKKMWKLEDFYDAERAVEFELKRILVEVISSFSHTASDEMDFSDALKACIAGKKITNKNWNGTDQYVIVMRGYPLGVPANEALSQVTGIKEGSAVTIEPYLMLHNAQGRFVNWVPSTGDLFSTGWKVIE